MKKNKKLDKPGLHTTSYYEYMDCKRWLAHEHPTLWSEGNESNLWHYLCDCYEMHNGLSIDLSYALDDLDEVEEAETLVLKQMLKVLLQEFPDNEFLFSW